MQTWNICSDQHTQHHIIYKLGKKSFKTQFQWLILSIWNLILKSKQIRANIQTFYLFDGFFRFFFFRCNQHSSPNIYCPSWQEHNTAVSGSKWAVTCERLKMENHHNNCTLFKRNTTCAQSQSKFYKFQHECSLYLLIKTDKMIHTMKIAQRSFYLHFKRTKLRKILCGLFSFGILIQKSFTKCIVI